MLPFTQKMLLDWAGAQVFRDAKGLFERGAVQVVSFDPPFIKGTVSVGGRSISSRSKVHTDGTCENLCPCRDNQERGIICAHVIALGLALIRRAADPDIERRRVEEARKAAKLARVNEADFIRRAGPDQLGGIPARVEVEVEAGWASRAPDGRVPVRCYAGLDGQRIPLDQLPRDRVYAFPSKDEAILFVLEDISEGPARGQLDLPPADFVNLLKLHEGRGLAVAGRAEPAVVNGAKMTTVLRMDLDRENGELILLAHTELPFLRPGEFPHYIIAGRGGWVYGAGNFWPLANLLPDPLRAIYDQPIAVPRPAVPRFLREELPLLQKHIQVDSEITADLFTIEPEPPKFRLALRGSAASLAPTLLAVYGEVVLPAGKADPAGFFSHPDPADLLRYTVRHPAAEAAALRRVGALGFPGESGDALQSLVGYREVLNFLGRDLPALRRLGWQVELLGKVAEQMETMDFATPVVQVTPQGAGDWFEVSTSFDAAGATLAAADIQRALLRGESYVERDGRTILLDAGAIQAMNDVFSDCASGEGGRPGSFRLPGIYAPFVQSSLDALDGIDVEAAPAWRLTAEQQNRDLRIEPVALAEPLAGTLRSYQKDGVNWLRFLETHGFGGVLADEMGLGKTLQTLAWLQLERSRAEAQGKPALIVCPTSLVDNWAEEAAKFTPHLRVLTVTGGDRHDKWEQVPASHLVVTSYALLRRDIDRYVQFEFSAAVLDEAQHIKNRSTQNAIAAKRIPAVHRLVLTGTPIENSVSDLWSIMDYLMPGYLGGHDAFRSGYELPIAAGGEGAAAPQAKLRRKLHPFLLRRLKTEVAKDLPPKIEKLASCGLSPDQQAVYTQLLESSRRRLFDMVAAQGFQRSRMEILKTLLQLRQVCCHLDLLKLADLKSSQPSAKLDLFFELLDEALDGGHRILVFSQFVSMLTILRRELEKRGVRYCYLDGSTQDRLKIVHEFNANKDIPAFLISLKAGGSGLNLTGADMVIHFDPWWNPAVEDQATDRAHRIGQKRTVYSLKLITRGTVEEKVVELQKRKKSVIDATLAKDDEAVMSSLTWDDVQELLKL